MKPIFLLLLVTGSLTTLIFLKRNKRNFKKITDLKGWGNNWKNERIINKNTPEQNALGTNIEKEKKEKIWITIEIYSFAMRLRWRFIFGWAIYNDYEIIHDLLIKHIF